MAASDPQQYRDTNPTSSTTGETSQESTLVVPTAEQEAIYAHTKPPAPRIAVKNSTTTKDGTATTKNLHRHIIRITAGAGTGKTTAILNVAIKAASAGHTHITYVTFSKAAAADGQSRISQTLKDMDKPPIVEARTLHSCAMKLVYDQRKKEGNDQQQQEQDELDDDKLYDDEQLEKFIKDVCKTDIEHFLRHAKSAIADGDSSSSARDPEKRKQRLESAYRQVFFFIQKTLSNFCRSDMTYEQFIDPSNRRRNYYPATLFHGHNGDGESRGFPTAIYTNQVGCYADMAVKVWDTATQKNVRTYDIQMKRAELAALRIPGTLLLVDESQDLDGCQGRWIATQVDYGTHVYLVGDAAQTIYSFRGAKSKYMMNLGIHEQEGAVVDCTLTKSWRFGPEIANIANIVLFAKERSPQTTGNTYAPIWKPYRVEGCAQKGAVTDESILSKWKEMQVTVIAASNATLMLTAVQLFGLSNSKDSDGRTVESSSSKIEKAVQQIKDEPTQEEVMETATDGVHLITPPDVSDEESKSPAGEANDSLTGSKASLADIAVDQNRTEMTNTDSLPEISLPKIHINGKGENSGMRKWQSVVKQIDFIHELYTSGDIGYSLPKKKFPEFDGRKLMWQEFLTEVENREISRLQASISVVQTFEGKTMEAIDLFKRHVMDANYTAEDADIILTTCHAAKGMEWDNVVICEDLYNLSNVNRNGPFILDPKTNARRSSWQFGMKKYGDDANLLYVACTRAKKLLSIPSSIKALLWDCDMLHNLIRVQKLYEEIDGKKDSKMCLFGMQKALNVSDALDLYRDLVLPLRQQYSLRTKDRLADTLVSPIEGDILHSKDFKATDGDSDFEAYFQNSTVVPPPPADTKPTARIYKVLEHAQSAAALAPKEIHRPYDKIDFAPTGNAKCRDCGKFITKGSKRIGIQVYRPEKLQFWASYFHNSPTCCPRDSHKLLRLKRRSSLIPDPKGGPSKRKFGFVKMEITAKKDRKLEE